MALQHRQSLERLSAAAAHLALDQEMVYTTELSLENEEPFAYEDDIEPCRFRFLDCQTFVDDDTICIQEYSELPTSEYAAVSYVWRGLRPSGENDESTGDFSVKGAEDADPISFSVLRTACIAALHFECPLLWLDRLSIIQTSKEDKVWQIRNMYHIYRTCKVCLILPGGLARLAGLNEVTPWIHRAWTLQESLAPPSAQVVFSWSLGSCYLQHSDTVEISEIVPQLAATTSLAKLLQASMIESYIRFDHPDNLQSKSSQDETRYICPAILSDKTEAGGDSHLSALMGALTQSAEEGKMNAIWRSALLRTSSRPVDMVFSIMGILGVSLDPASFDVQDRRRATIQLVKQLMQNGSSVEWLGVAPSMRIPAGLSTLPVMPRTSVEGCAMLDTVDGVEEVAKMLGEGSMALWWWLDGAPTGVMDDDGKLSITTRATAIEKLEGTCNDFETDEDDESVVIADCATRERWTTRTSIEALYYALNIGQKRHYRHGFVGKLYDPKTTLLMLLGPATGPSNSNLGIIGYAWADSMIADNWFEHSFDIRP